MAGTKFLKEIDYAEIFDFSVVGRGSYGTVYKARWKNQIVAVKGFEFDADIKAIETEIKQLSRVVHPNIIALYGVSIAYSRIHLVMEYAEGGSLHSFLHGPAKPYYSAAHAMSWACQCAEGVAYLHGMRPKPLIHRDLKPLNLLLVNKCRNLKICDFGTVADKSTLMTNNKGSAAWMAPEVFRGSTYTEKCDVFSWSIILWQIMSREQPYKDFGLALSIMWYVNQGNRPQLIKSCPKLLEKLMISCWDQTPENRPSMDHVVEVMKKFCKFFPGADQPLDYESSHEQNEKLQNEQFETNTTSSLFSAEKENEQSETNIANSLFCADKSLDKNDDTSSNTPTNFENFSEITQMRTPTDLDNQDTSKDIPINVNSLKSPLFKGNELDALSQEFEFEFMNKNNSNGLNQSRVNDIRNGMLKNQHVTIEPLSIEVDPDAWDLKNDYYKMLDDIAKSEGKERLTVTEKKSDTPSDETVNDDLNAAIGDGKDDDSGGGHSNDGSSVGEAAIGIDTEEDDTLNSILDAELQAEKPDPNSKLSQEIYQEHQKLAKEYLRVDTELYYATTTKEKLLESMGPEEKQEKLTVLKKLMEKEELMGLYKDLQKQLEQLKAAQGVRNIPPSVQLEEATNQQQPETQNIQKSTTPDEPPDQSEDGWVFIPSNQS